MAVSLELIGLPDIYGLFLIRFVVSFNYKNESFPYQ